ncbi:MAG: metal ABC transporter permease [Alphaproteobacteria bacterium]|nr:metal ABC transporter permease [Alphaproteobacteria bacterium SS10]
MNEFVALSLIPILIGVLAALTCALPGNFLLLRRQALIGDAISHVVLPGIVVGFLISGAVTTWPMLLGAAVAAVIAVTLIELIRQIGKVEAGAAMGVVFTSMFAAGVLLLEITDTSQVHLDVEHALYGNLESLIWLSGTSWGSIFDPAALADLPAAFWRVMAALALVASFIAVFWRVLKISTFDPAYAATLGIPVRLLSFALVVLVSIAAVAAFDAVGSIIVIAMMICPPAAARLMTDQLGRQIAWSCLFAVLSAVAGYALAGYGPIWLGFDNAVSAAGMIAAVSGAVLLLACCYGPHRQRLAA